MFYCVAILFDVESALLLDICASLNAVMVENNYIFKLMLSDGVQLSITSSVVRETLN